MAHDSQNTQKVSPSPPRCLTCLSLRAPGVVSVLGMSDVSPGYLQHRTQSQSGASVVNTTIPSLQVRQDQVF